MTYGVGAYVAGKLLHHIVNSRGERKEIEALIKQVTGEKATDEAYDQVSEEIHRRKDAGQGGTKNKKGDFTKKELRKLIEDVLGEGDQ